jgi:hypothetical protein
MAWPNDRLTTYTPDDPIKSNDLNAMQDAIMSGQHDDHVLNLSPFHSVRDANWSIGTSVTLGDLGYIVSTAAGHCLIPFALKEGDRLKSLVFARYGDGAADFTSIKVYKVTSAGVVSDITAAPTSVINPAAAWADTTVDITDTTCAAGDHYFVQFVGSAANLRICGVRLTFDHP